MNNNNSYNLRRIIYSAWDTARKAVASPWIRRHRSWIFQAAVLIILLAFSALALLANTTPYFRVDLQFTHELQLDTPGWFGTLMQATSWPGYAIPSISIIALAVIFLTLFGLRWEAIAALFAAMSSGAINYLVKIVVRRPRPTPDLVDVFQKLNSFSFPSGHVMFYTTFFGFLLFLTFILLKRSWKRTVLMVFFLSLILLVGPSRMYLGEHWGSDVLGGYLLGSLTLILSIQFYHWGKQKFAVEQPVAPETEDEFDAMQSIPVTSHEDDDPNDTDRDKDHPDRPRQK